MLSLVLNTDALWVACNKSQSLDSQIAYFLDSQIAYFLVKQSQMVKIADLFLQIPTMSG
jgi:hypothetical protein